MTFYRRRLPHWCPEGAVVFLTWRLFGTLPCHTVDQAHSLLTDGQASQLRTAAWMSPIRVLDGSRNLGLQPVWPKLCCCAGAFGRNTICGRGSSWPITSTSC